MTIPLIAINRVDAGSYQWALLAGHDIHDQGGGLSSITECLSEGIAHISEISRIEISYRGTHFGTYLVKEIERQADEVAERIVNRYSELFA